MNTFILGLLSLDCGILPLLKKIIIRMSRITLGGLGILEIGALI
jgi:hypothetical protein